MQREGPEMMRYAYLRIQILCQISGILSIQVAECTVDGQERNFGLHFDRLCKRFSVIAGVAGVIYLNETKVHDEAHSIGSQFTVVAVCGVELEFAQVDHLTLCDLVHLACVDACSLCSSDAVSVGIYSGLLRHQSGHCVDVEVIAMLVRREQNVECDLIGIEKRSSQSLECIAFFGDCFADIVGEIGVDCDELAAVGLESKTRLAQPEYRNFVFGNVYCFNVFAESHVFSASLLYYFIYPAENFGINTFLCTDQ